MPIKHTCGWCATWKELRLYYDMGLKEDVEAAGRRLLREHPESHACKKHWWFYQWVIGMPKKGKACNESDN